MTSNNTMAVHDLRLKVNNRVAQDRSSPYPPDSQYLCLGNEVVSFEDKITENGDFLRWSTAQKAGVGLESPFAQNERHIAVLTDAFKKIDMPSRMGVKLAPVFHPWFSCLLEAQS